MNKQEQIKKYLEQKNPSQGIIKILEKIQTLKGDQGIPGYTPVKGKDYFTEKEINMMADHIQSKVKNGRDGDRGLPGKDGITPTLGVDYFTRQDKENILNDVLKKVPQPKDGISPNVDDVVNKAVDVLKQRPINFKDIKGTEDLVAFLKLGGFRGGGGGGTGSSISLQTNGSPNGSQSLLNLVAGSNVTLTDNGSGSITIASSGSGGSGTVTTVSVVSANGFAGTVATATTTPAITLTTTITGILQGNGTAISAATTGNLTDVGTDGITIGSGTGAVLGSGTTISQHVADASHNGYLSSTDWSTFNNKGSGTVTAVSIATANGFSGSSSGGATPALTIFAGAITPTSVNGVVFSGSGTPTLAVTGTSSISGSNTGDQTITLTSDVTGSGTGSFATTIRNDVSLGGSPTTTTQAFGDNSTKIATTAFVAAAVLGQNFKEAAKYASTGALPTVVYDSGLGTLTGFAVGAISLDGSSPVVNDRVLIKNQVSQFQNGIYKVTATGSGIAVFVLTRTSDANVSGDFKTGDSIFVTAGNTLATTTWAYTGIDSPNFTSDAITYAQVAGQGSFTGGNGITITGTSIAIDTSITVDKTTAQTLTNKTLTSSTNVLGGVTMTLGSDATNDMYYRNGSGVLTRFASANSGVLITSGAGVPSISTTLPSGITLVAPVLGTPASGNLTNCTSLPISGLTSSTVTALGVGSIELGNASDTTLARVSSGVVSIEGNNIMTVASTDTVTGAKTMSSIILPDQGTIRLTTPTTDLKCTGFTTSDYNSGYSSTAIGDLVYLDSSATWQKCDNTTSAATQSGLLGIALTVTASGNPVTVALPGSFIYSTTGFPTWTIGGTIYMSTAAAMTQTQPSASNAAIRVVGWGVHADKLYFYPSPDYIIHV